MYISYENSLVCAVTPIKLLEYKYQLEENETSLLFNKLIEELQEEDNPVLFFYEFD